MDYPLMEPPFEVKPFEKMTKKEAQIHFEWYVSEIPNRIELLRRAYEIMREGNKDKLDLSPQSLIFLWEWFLPNIEITLKDKEEIEREVQIAPDWLKENIQMDNKKLSLGTLTLLMDIAIYFGEVFVNNFDNIKWGYVTRPKSLAYVNKPVLTGFRTNIELDPRNLVYIATLKVVKGVNNRDTLYNLYNVWKDKV